MLHKFAEHALPLSGFSSGFAFLLAQDGTSWEKVGTMGAVVVISCLLAFIITQRDPKAQEKVAALIEALTKEYTTTNRHNTEKLTGAIEKIQQEYTIAIQGITKDHKDLVQSTIKDLLEEKVVERKGMFEHFNRVIDVLREADFKGNPRPSSNEKGIGS